MKVHIIAVGLLKKGPEKDLIDHYTKQIRSPFTISEIDPRRYPLQNDWQSRIKELCPDQSLTICLDENGQNWTSHALSQKINTWQNNGYKNLCFWIGGADGFTDDFIKQADIKLSLGSMTWPHMLARVMIVEQIYRSQQILAGHPYHRS
jgi:23S rRNA (pseudouridine1915-N3)-methyltransferase